MTIIDPLTPREEQVLFALADGLDTIEISREFFISPETVKSNIKHLLEKLSARNRTHAVAIAYHEGILTPKARV